MPGPPPKNPKTRQRRNKASTASRIPSKAAAARVPELPERPCSCGGVPSPAPKKKRGRGRPPTPRPPCRTCHGTGVLLWHPLTLVWWRDTWASPMAKKFLRADRHGLYRLAAIIEDFWVAESAGERQRLSAEIRLAGMPYGCTPLDRTRLQWEIEDEDESKPQSARAATGTDDGAPGDDELERVTNVLDFRS